MCVLFRRIACTKFHCILSGIWEIRAFEQPPSSMQSIGAFLRVVPPPYVEIPEARYHFCGS